MSTPYLWMAIEPTQEEVKLLLSAGRSGTLLKARLSPDPVHPRAMMTLFEALSLWYGQPLHAVLDADGSDVRRRPDRWTEWLSDAPGLAVHVEWAAVPVRCHNRFLEDMGCFSSARRLTSFVATGQR